MEQIKRLLRWLKKWEYTWLLLLVLLTLAIHFSLITNPPQTVFDEYHYVTDARNIIEKHVSERAEHPPLGKLMVVAGIYLFGDNAFGWRFFSIIFGTISIILFYLICRRLGMSRRASSLATFLLSLENLTFLQASVAMLDVYTVTFMLLAFWLYLKDHYLLSGVAVALCMLAKLNGVLVLPVILLHLLLSRKATLLKFLAPIASAFLAFMLLMPLFEFAISREFVDPATKIWVMWTQSGSLTFNNVQHEAASRPWEWVLRPEVMAYYYIPHYIGAISFTLWAAIIPAVLYMGWRAVKRNNAALFGISWFICIYLLWIPISLITDRISFVYYFYPAVGAICIGVGTGLSQLFDISWNRSIKVKRTILALISFYLFLHVVVFIGLSPLSSWWKYPIPPPTTTTTTTSYSGLSPGTTDNSSLAVQSLNTSISSLLPITSLVSKR